MNYKSNKSYNNYLIICPKVFSLKNSLILLIKNNKDVSRSHNSQQNYWLIIYCHNTTKLMLITPLTPTPMQ